MLSQAHWLGNGDLVFLKWVQAVTCMKQVTSRLLSTFHVYTGPPWIQNKNLPSTLSYVNVQAGVKAMKTQPIFPGKMRQQECRTGS